MYEEQIFTMLMLIVAVLAMALVVGSVRSYWRKLRADPRFASGGVQAPRGSRPLGGAGRWGGRVGLWGSRLSCFPAGRECLGRNKRVDSVGGKKKKKKKKNARNRDRVASIAARPVPKDASPRGGPPGRL